MRFNNPHAGQPNMAQHQQFVPVQQQYPQQQPQPVAVGMPHQQFMSPQQYNAMMMQQGVMPAQQFVQQGMVAPQQFVPNQAPMVMVNQGQQFQQPVQTGLGNTRFTSNNDQQQFEAHSVGNRYKENPMPQQQQQFQVAEQVPVKEQIFVVKPTVHKFPGSEDFKLNTFTVGFADSNLVYEEAYVASDALSSVAEYLLERVNGGEITPENRRMANAQNLIVNNTFFNVEMRERLLELLDNDGKALLKLARGGDRIQVSNRYELSVIDMINRILTKKVNDFLSINFEVEISIDSFFDDYADLLVAVRSADPHMEDPLTDMLGDYLRDNRIIMDCTEVGPNSTVISERVLMVALDKHTLETGLEEAQEYFMEVADTASNVFLRTLAGAVMTKTGKSEFTLLTMDKQMFDFVKSKDTRLFVRKSN